MHWTPTPSSKRRPARRRKPDKRPLETLTVPDLIVVNGLDLPRDFDLDEATPVPGVRSLPGLAEVATRGVKYVEAHPGGPVPGLCAVYVHTLMDLLPFEPELNYRAAVRTLRFTARLNRWEDSFSDEDWRRFQALVARGDITEEQLATFVTGLMRPRWRAM